MEIISLVGSSRRVSNLVLDACNCHEEPSLDDHRYSAYHKISDDKVSIQKVLEKILELRCICISKCVPCLVLRGVYMELYCF